MGILKPNIYEALYEKILWVLNDEQSQGKNISLACSLDLLMHYKDFLNKACFKKKHNMIVFHAITHIAGITRDYRKDLNWCTHCNCKIHSKEQYFQ